jgi:hypothetical protein
VLRKKHIGVTHVCNCYKTNTKQIIKFLQKTFCSLHSRITTPYGLLAHYLAKVAKSRSYVETFSNNADTLHNWVKNIYEEDLKKAFELQVRRAIKNLKIYYETIQENKVCII